MTPEEGRVLVVRSNENFVESLRAKLKDWGYSTEGTTDMDEALTMVPDLVEQDIGCVVLGRSFGRDMDAGLLLNKHIKELHGDLVKTVDISLQGIEGADITADPTDLDALQQAIESV